MVVNPLNPTWGAQAPRAVRGAGVGERCTGDAGVSQALSRKPESWRGGGEGMPRVWRIRGGGGGGAEGLSHHPSMQRFPQGRDISLLLSGACWLGCSSLELMDLSALFLLRVKPFLPVPPKKERKNKKERESEEGKKRKNKKEQEIEERKRIQRCMEE